MKKDIVVKLGLLFYFCNIVGYLYELILHFIYNGNFSSHGILYGPWLPIYGVGSLLFMLFYKFRYNPVLIFFLSFFSSGVLEYFTGLFLLKVLKKRLWDYTGMFLNISGHICLLSLLIFSVGGLLITYIIYPLIERIYHIVDKKILEKLLYILSFLFLIDVVASIIK